MLSTRRLVSEMDPTYITKGMNTQSGSGSVDASAAAGIGVFPQSSRAFIEFRNLIITEP